MTPPIQLKLSVDLERIIKINDAVYSFSEVMAHIDLQKYFVEKGHETGRPKYDREKLLKIVLFAFMEFGYCPVRFIQPYDHQQFHPQGAVRQFGESL
ncbi:MAG: hypothetical protein EGP94_10185, partial [Lachnospiraceae bacterium]|nr:hypothetical protein [Lachnospiraceae bacterium]